MCALRTPPTTVEMRLVETLCELALVFGAPCPQGHAPDPDWGEFERSCSLSKS